MLFPLPFNQAASADCCYTQQFVTTQAGGKARDQEKYYYASMSTLDNTARSESVERPYLKLLGSDARMTLILCRYRSGFSDNASIAGRETWLPFESDPLTATDSMV